jgi:hypothetical protein
VLSEWKLLLILHSLDGKKLIRELFLINVLVILLISLSFKGYRICLFDMKEYLFYFDDQQIYRNGCLDSWTNLMTYQFIIFRIIVSWIFHSNLLLGSTWFSQSYYKFILFVIVKSELYFDGFDNWPVVTLQSPENSLRKRTRFINTDDMCLKWENVILVIPSLSKKYISHVVPI